MRPGLNETDPAESGTERHWCPACQRDVVEFGPGGPKARPNAKCPYCGALERHRFLAYVLDQHAAVLATSDAVLDIAPQKQIAALLKRQAGQAYVATDLFDHLDIDIRTDLTTMPFVSGTFDAIVCYHVLEHIPDDRAAMRELSRVLKPGGLLFLQVPWRRQTITDEDPDAPVEERLRRFGQDDHVRYYGSDFEDRLAQNGLRPGRIRPSSLLTQSQLRRYGIPAKDFMWICRPMVPQELDVDPELSTLRKTEDVAVAERNLDRLEIERLRAQTLQMRRELVQAQVSPATLAGNTDLAGPRDVAAAVKNWARPRYHRLVKIDSIAPAVRLARRGYRRVESARRRRHSSAGGPAPKGKLDKPAPEVFRNWAMRRFDPNGLAQLGVSTNGIQPPEFLRPYLSPRIQVSTDPGFDPTAERAQISVAKITDVDPWLANPTFDDFDLAVTDRPEIAAAVRTSTSQVAVMHSGDPDPVLRSWADATRFALCIATPDRAQAPGWGDTYFARDVQRSLRRLGHPARVYLRDEFTDPTLIREDVSVHIAGRALPKIRRDQVSVLWIISHPNRVRIEQCNQYDLILVASRTFAAHLQTRVSPPVFPLMQATDPARLVPDPTGPSHDVLFVGNSRLTARRRIIDDLTPTDLNLAVYGRDWYPEFVDPRHVQGEFVPHDQLAAYYSSAKIVLNDHWPDMAQHGFISNRLYDALASGAFIVSDSVSGMDEEFDDGVVTYRDRDDLDSKIRAYLRHEHRRQEIAGRGHHAVLDRHTFDHRVRRLLQLVEPLLPRPLTPMGLPAADASAVSAPVSGSV